MVVAVAYRSVEYMPPPRLVVELEPEPPKLGPELVRLRKAQEAHERALGKRAEHEELTQQAAADRIPDLSRSRLNQFEKGERVPDGPLRRIAACYADVGASFETLYDIQQRWIRWDVTRTPLRDTQWLAIQRDDAMAALLSAVHNRDDDVLYEVVRIVQGERRPGEAWEGEEEIAAG